MPTTAISRHKLRCKISVIEYRERFKGNWQQARVKRENKLKFDFHFL